MSETGYVIEPICGGQPSSDQMWSNFLWLLVLSLMLFGKDGKPTEDEKEDTKDGKQSVPAVAEE